LKRLKVILSTTAVLLLLTGCVGTQQNQSEHNRKELSEACKVIYTESLQNGTLGNLDTVGKLTEKLGEKGYAVVDQDNQFNMKNSSQAEEFLRKADNKQNAELMMIMVLNNGGFVRFHLKTEEGRLEVSATSFGWKEGELHTIYTDEYEASTWVVSENGYLFFEKYYMPGFSGPYGHVAVRVKPLDDAYRQLNRSYIYPIGYYSNNLFITDWSETDYRDLNFYDVFERFYQPHAVTNDMEVLQIPKTDFEGVLMKYFKVSSQTLQKKARYIEENQMYQYSPRGLEDSCPSLEIPYPEVIDCESRNDGTMVLTVNAVWPEKNMGTAFRHQVTIRPLPNGTFHYVSNQIILSKENAKPSWYVGRLTE
jgi:hypothetical protein